ncbi:MAG TPA: DUF4265 domain-containing protein [Chloroflexia bacterium]|nr:DUF4265 domain-containing protein [Chloroflexia bacterium]
MGEQIKIRFNLENDPDIPFAGENIWAEKIGPNAYRLLNIPYHAKGYAEGDIVRCIKRNGIFEITGIAQDSGNSTLRILFIESHSPQAQKILDELVSSGCTYERASTNLVGITVPFKIKGKMSRISDYLNRTPADVVSGWEIGKY